MPKVKPARCTPPGAGESSSYPPAAQAVIFDFDGVIVDSEPVHEEGLRRAATVLGRTVTHERYVAEYVGYDDRDCVHAVARDHGRTLSVPDAAAMMERKKREVAELLAAGRAPAYP